MRKYLFLDIDGVLNSRDTFEREAEPWWAVIDVSMVSLVNLIVYETKCIVILSSAWRLSHSIDEIQKELNKKGAKFIIADKTPSIMGPRGFEIQKYMKVNGINEKQIIILDDCDDMMHLNNRLIHTSFEKGLTFRKAKEAINKLNEVD